MVWTVDKINKLTQLWGKGNTASQIAQIIGDVTRNAVIGKANRLNLSNKLSPKSTINNSNNCEGGHWVKTVANQGEIITLEDGSLWQVDAIDKVYSSIWLPISNVTICGSYLINTDDGEKVSATRIK